MYKVCKFCHTPFDARPEHHFCSMNCWREYCYAKHDKTCKFCGKALAKRQWLRNQSYCSRKCSGLAYRERPPRSQKEPKTCLTCSNQFTPKEDKTQYCSRECYYASYRQENFTCQQCGVTMRGRPGRAFCSVECYAQFRKEHKPPRPTLPYGPGWKRTKREILKRDNYICQECGGLTDGRKLDVHHITPFLEFGIKRYEEANAPSNLISLCRSCHMNRHTP